MLSERYQYSLILLSAILTMMFGIFVCRELFPEYKIYQNTYVELENIRAANGGQAPPAFKHEVKQVVIPKPDLGPETIDRCVSCHVATKLSHFSPTKIALNINGNPVLDEHGVPVKVPNDEYIWDQIDSEITELRDSAVNAQLESEGNGYQVTTRLAKADHLEGLKTVGVGEYEYDMTKVLAMHPLIGRESMPFEYHSLEEYGCTSCHSGNGRGLVTDRAHGPVFDGQYEEAHMGPEPHFLEHDSDNDPMFAQAFNHKPGHRLLFQTTPILVGGLMQAKCVQCHQTSTQDLDGVVSAVESVAHRKERQLSAVQQSILDDQEALVSLLSIDKMLSDLGMEQTVSTLQKKSSDFKRSPKERRHLEAQLEYLSGVEAKHGSLEDIQKELGDQLVQVLGSEDRANELRSKVSSPEEVEALVATALSELKQAAVSGSIFEKMEMVSQTRDGLRRIKNASLPLEAVSRNSALTGVVQVETDHLTASFQRGQQLFRSTACYACHKIAGYSRGGVGPELTQIGLYYPWYIKESIVWPQGSLPSSTMPNFKLDSEEIEDLMAYLLAQTGESKAIAEYTQAVHIKEWDAGAKMPWEKALAPEKISDVEASKLIFATEGCAACHRLRGFDSAVDFVDSKETDFDTHFAHREWFKKRFPDDLAGSILVQTLEEYADEIDQRIVADAGDVGMLEEIERDYPRFIESMYSNFKYAFRAKNKHYSDLLAQAGDDVQRAQAESGLRDWRERINRVLMVYIQEYGLGRHIGPNLHWSGVYRDTEWLVGHFRNPGSHSAKSIMPVMPFDDSKFYALTNMLQVVGQQNRDLLREVWDQRGFDPELAYEWQCADCHGKFMAGNGPIADWIYPIPKNLRNATFLRNLTRERAVQSIVHGVLGGPMPPWGEAPLVQGKEPGSPVMSRAEIEQLVDWLYQGLQGGRVIRSEEDVRKWQYDPEDVIRDLDNEGNLRRLQRGPEPLEDQLQGDGGEWKNVLVALESDISGYFCALTPPLVQEQAASLEAEVRNIFDVVDNSLDDAPEGAQYYLKRKFFTPENLAEGKRLFIANCAHCHGKEGGGNGDRATTMDDAKPRMLANLPWLRTRDDLRILRSIKYGVPGTSMTPWGDKTDTYQRMQIVTYIRSLSDERKQREDLISALFQSFESAVIAIETVRSTQSADLAQLQSRYEGAVAKREEAFLKVQSGEADSQTATQAYSDELARMQEVRGAEGVDTLLTGLIDLLRGEQKLYETLGRSMISKGVPQSSLDSYVQLISANAGRYGVASGRLTMSVDDLGLVQRLGEQLISVFEKGITELAAQKARLKGRIRSAQRTKDLAVLDVELAGSKELRGKLITTLEEAKRSRERQASLYADFQKQQG